MSHIKITAKPRLATEKPKAIRRQGGVPANVISAHQPSLAITLSTKDVQKLLTQGQDSALIYLTIEGSPAEVPVLFDEIQTDGLTGQTLHVAFKQVSLKAKTKAEIPLELVGEISTPNLVLVKVLEFVEIEALPTDLPEKIEVQISGLTEAGQSILLKDLQIDTTKLHLVASEADLDGPVVLLQAPRVEVVEEISTEVVETEVLTAAKPTEAGEASKPSANQKAGADSQSHSSNKA
ncbi:MAG TPA: 50S ribosomal protein L25 [Candidatus Pacebacteria bacterium]|nr:50S ribosomal protein L25 [Candidatus Paceibacterota bacterium]